MRVMLLCGISFLFVFLISPLLPLFSVGILSLILLISTVVLSKTKFVGSEKAALICFFLGTAFSLFVLKVYKDIKPLEKFIGKEVAVLGMVEEGCSENYSGFSYTLRIKTINGMSHSGKITVFSSEENSFKRGENVKLFVTIKSPDNGDTYKERLLNRAKSVYLYGNESFSPVKIGENKILCPVYSLSDKISQSILSALPEKSGRLLSGVLINNKDALYSDEREMLSNAGYSHLINVSGLHLSIVAAVFYSVFLFIFSRRQRLASLFTIGAIIFYVALTAFSVSAVRAGIMLTIFYIAKLSFRRSDSLNSLGLAVTVILAINPFAAYDISLLLSASSTFGIIYLSKTLSLLLRENKISNKASRVLGLLLPSFTALIFSMPVLAVFFGSVNLISPFSNIALHIFITPFLMFGMLFCLSELMGLMIVRQFFVLVLKCIGNIIFFLSEIFSKPKFLEIKTENVGTQLFIFFLGILLTVVFSEIKKNTKKIFSVFLVILLIISVFLTAAESLYTKI